MATLKWLSAADANLQVVTLGSAYTAASGSMALTGGHGARLPAAGDFWLMTTSGTRRVFKVTARSTDTLTVTPAQDGTADGNLDSGAELKWTMDVSAWEQVLSERNRVITVSAFDALASTEYRNGDRIVLEDGVYEVVRSGGAWKYLYRGQKAFRPPSADWSWDNQASSTVDHTNGYPYLSTPKSSSVSLSAYYRTAPAAPYTIKALLKHDLSGAPPGTSGAGVNSGYGLAFRDSAGKLIDLRFSFASDGLSLSTNKWTNATTYSAGYTSYASAVGNAGSPWDLVLRQEHWLAISNDDTDLKFYWSIDGRHWKLFDSHAKNNFFATAPNAYGLIAYANGNAVELAAVSLEETASGTP